MINTHDTFRVHNVNVYIVTFYKRVLVNLHSTIVANDDVSINRPIRRLLSLFFLARVFHNSLHLLFTTLPNFSLLPFQKQITNTYL